MGNPNLGVVALVFVASWVAPTARGDEPAAFELGAIGAPVVSRVSWPPSAVDTATVHTPAGIRAVVASTGRPEPPVVVAWYAEGDGRLLAAVEIGSTPGSSPGEGLGLVATGPTPGRAAAILHARQVAMGRALERGIGRVVLSPEGSTSRVELAPLLTTADGGLVALSAEQPSSLWRHDSYRLEIEDGNGRRRYRGTLTVAGRVAPVEIRVAPTSPNLPTDVIVSNPTDPAAGVDTVLELAPIPPLRWASPPDRPDGRVVRHVPAGATINAGRVSSPKPGTEVIGYVETVVTAPGRDASRGRLLLTGPSALGPTVATGDRPMIDAYTSLDPASLIAEIDGSTVPLEPGDGPEVGRASGTTGAVLKPLRLALPAAGFIIGTLGIREQAEPDGAEQEQIVTVVPVKLDAIPVETANGAPPGSSRRLMPDTGDVLVSGVAVTGERLREILDAQKAAGGGAAPASAPAETPVDGPCECGDCELLRVVASHGEFHDTDDDIPVGAALRLSVEARADCPPGCPLTVDGTWHLTFLPYTSSEENVILDRRELAPQPGATTFPPVEIVERGATADFRPDTPGTLVAHFRGRCRCGDAECPGPATMTSRELTVGFPPPDPRRLARIVDNVRAALPDIPTNERGRADPADVAAWLTATTGWRPGTRYHQVFELPEGAVAVRSAHVVSSTWINLAWAYAGDDPLRPGDSYRSSERIFGVRYPTQITVSGAEGNIWIEYEAPFIDRVHLKVEYVDRDGERHEVRRRCEETTSDGKAVDPCQGPSPGEPRVIFMNIDPSRFSDDVDAAMFHLFREIAGRFGGIATTSSMGQAWDEDGRPSFFLHERLWNVQVCAKVIAGYLEELAAALGAEIEVSGQLIIVRGADFGEEGLVPPHLGGRSRPERRRPR